MSGEGIYADQIRQTFSLFKARFGLEQELPVLRRDLFRRPNLDGQLELFLERGSPDPVLYRALFPSRV